MTASQAQVIERHVVDIGNRVHVRSDEVTAEMTATIARLVDHLDDDHTHAILQASVEGNVSTILHMLRNSVPVARAVAPASAIEYALRLAQRGISADSLRRAYHLGTETLRRRFFDEVLVLDASDEVKLHVSQRLQTFMHQYIDRVSIEVQQAYAAEAQQRAERSASATAAVIREVLTGAEVDPGRFERLTRYRLDQRHLAAVLWIDEADPGVDRSPVLSDLAAEIARHAGPRSSSLFAAVDRGMGWAWCGLGEEARDLHANPDVLAAIEAVPGARAAFGAPARGAEGFRRTHGQAEAAARVMGRGRRSALRTIGYADPGVAVTAVLVGDLEATRSWVQSQLGELAESTESAQRLRDTLECFLENESSYTRTAQHMNLHRNSVKYRVERAVESRGRPVAESATDLAMALTVCRLLGDAVTSAPRGHPDGAR